MDGWMTGVVSYRHHFETVAIDENFLEARPIWVLLKVIGMFYSMNEVCLIARVINSTLFSYY